MPLKTLAERTRFARERAGFAKEADAARAIGCSRPLVISWENGTANSIGGRFLTSAAKAYKVRPDWLTLEVDEDGYPWESTAPPPASQDVREQRDILTAAAVVMDYLRDFDSEPLTPERRKRRIDAALDVIEEVGIDRVLDGSMLESAARQVVSKTRRR